MKTAALLPSSGDPLLARYWLRNRETWRDEVDELIVYVNGDLAAVPIYEAAGAKVIASGTRMSHGDVLGELIRATDAELVVLVEDDAFVRRPGAIRSALDAVRRTDESIVIGCPRGGMDPAIAVAAEAKWGTVTGPDGSTGHGLWPCFLFGWTSDLRACSGFASRSWGAGETIPGLGYTCPSVMTTDTMTVAAFELRSRLRIVTDVQYKELWQKECSGTEPWFHAGGLSTDPASARPDIGMDNLEGKDWAHRFWWWRRIGHDYREHWERAAVDPDYWTPIIEPWITWDD